MCKTRKRGRFLDASSFFVVLCIKNQNPQSALSCILLVSSLISALRFSFSSEYSSHFSLVARVYLETRDLDEFPEKRDEKKREGK